MTVFDWFRVAMRIRQIAFLGLLTHTVALAVDLPPAAPLAARVNVLDPGQLSQLPICQ